ncbi:MAG TPA: CocE/NonD family hydrolase [Caulobacteraceae bacterium]
MNHRQLLAAAAAAFVLFSGPPAPRAEPAAAPPPLADTLIAAYAGRTQPRDLETLLRLQLASGRPAEAEGTIQRLAALYRPTQPGRAHALLPWRIYARAMRHEGAGLSTPDSLARAFNELYAPLPDREMVDVLPWYGANLDRLRQSLARAGAACEGKAVDACPNAAELVAARQAIAVWTYLMPASERLIRADAARRFLIEDLLIPTPDGARISAILVRPRAGGARLTSLLNFTIYARDDWSFTDAAKMAANGYAGVVAYTRGKGRSPGPIVPYEHDGRDAAAVIDWLAAQAWSDGRVGMFSGSYNASAQWGALKHRPKALRAIATNASNAPGVDTPMQGNVFQNFIYPWPLHVTTNRTLDEINYYDSARWAALDRVWYQSGRPYRELERIDGQPNPVFAKWLAHPDYDSYWQGFTPQGEEFARVDIPVFVQTGYYDGGMVGALHYLREHVRHRPDADHRLLVGPYHHTAMQTGVLPTVDGYDVDPAALIDLQDVRLKWFDHVFRGAPLPELLKDRVNYQVMGADLWRHASSLEAMAGERLRLYLNGRREGARFLFGEGGRAEGSAPELSVNFADRTDADFQPPASEPDTRNALVFVTEPLGKPMEVAGLFSGRFEIVTNKRDLDLSVAFFEQRADGRYLLLASYLGRASYIADRSRRQLLRPGRPQVLAFDSQTLTARRLAAGSRILAVVGVPKRPDIQINYGTGKDVSDESIADAGEPLHVRWGSGSYLELGVRR